MSAEPTHTTTTAPTRFASRRQRLFAPVSLALAAVGGGAFLCSGALFTGQATVSDNGFTAGTVRLGVSPATALFKTANMAPGDVITAPLTVRNDGSLTSRYAIESTATGALSNALRLAVKTGVSDCTNTGFGLDGTSLYSYGAIGTATGMKVAGDKATGPDQGDRQIDPGAAETLCVQVTLPGAGTGNDYQARSAQVAFTFYAEQTRNNSLVLAAPAAPAGSGTVAAQTLLTATPDATKPFVDLAWPEVTDKHVTSVSLYRTSDNGTTWQLLATVNPSVSTYTDNTTAQGTTYGYAIQSVGFDGTVTRLPSRPSPSSTIATGWLTPAAPTGVSATATPTSANVTWVASTSGWVTGYRVLRSADNGATWTTLDTVDGAGTTAYTDKTVTQGASYLYSIQALGKGETTSTQATSKTMAVPYQAPASVATVTATPYTDSTGSVAISWTASSGPNLTGYTVDRSDDDGSTWTTLGTVGADTTTYADTTAAQGSTYLYSVIGTGRGGNVSPRSTSTSLTVPYVAPAAPANVTATPSSTGATGSVALTWAASAGPNLTGYTVYRSTNGGSTWSTLTTTTDTTYTDTTTAQGATYLYSVIANGKGGLTSARTYASSVLVPWVTPGVVATLNATPSSTGATGSVALTWAASAGPNLTGYTVYRSTDSGATWSTLTTTTDTTYTDTTVSQGNTYVYGVAANGQSGDASAKKTSAAVTVAYVAPAAPANVTATLAGADVHLTWAASTSSWTTRYDVFRSDDNGATWTSLGSNSASVPGATTFTDASVPTGMTFIYGVVAEGSGGTKSAQTNSAPLATQPASGSVSTLVTGLGNLLSVAYGTDGYVYTAASNTGNLYKVNENTGAAEVLNSSFSDPRFVTYGTDGNLYLYDNNNRQIYKVNPTSGAASTVGSAFSSTQVISGLTYGADGYLYVTGFTSNTSNTGFIYRLTTTGSRTTIATSMSPGIGPITYATDGYLYVADSNNSSLIKVNRSTGVKTTMSTTLANPSGIAQGADGTLYVSSLIGNKVYAVNPTTGATTKTFTTPSVTIWGTAVSSKYVYFASNSTGSIYKIAL